MIECLGTDWASVVSAVWLNNSPPTYAAEKSSITLVGTVSYPPKLGRAILEPLVCYLETESHSPSLLGAPRD